MPLTPDLDADCQFPAGDIFAEACDPLSLLAAWNDLYEDACAEGHPNREVQRFGRDVLANLEWLRRTLADGTWRPGPVHRFTLPDGSRELTVGTVADRVVERAFAGALAAAVDDSLTPFSFGYRRGLGVGDAVAALRDCLSCGWTHVVRTDVARAFDEVPRVAAFQALAERVSDRRALRVVELLQMRLDDQGLGGVGIAQGSSLSPMLLNVYLDRLDRVLLAGGHTPIRYADDIAVPVAGPRQGEQVIETITRTLEDLQLRINPNKTTIIPAEHGVEFLGKRVRGLGGDPHDPASDHPQRITVYGCGQPGVARLSRGRIRIDRDGQTVASAHLDRVRQVVLVGRFGVTTPLIRASAHRGVEIILLGEHGGLDARIGLPRRGDVRVRAGQHQRALYPDLALNLAADMVAAKLANARVIVLRARRDGFGGSADARVADTVEAAHDLLPSASNTAELMGLEGTASRAYFQWMADRLDAQWGFTGRNRRPPRDPINAMLSFGYTLLCNELVTACELAHLDPELGFLHSPHWGRPSLAIDLMEQWRPVIVDAAVLGLVHRQHVSTEDFQVEGRDGGCRMNDKARRALLGAYEKQMLRITGSNLAQGRRSLREWVWQSAAVLARLLAEDDYDHYRGHRIR